MNGKLKDKEFIDTTNLSLDEWLNFIKENDYCFLYSYIYRGLFLNFCWL